MITESLTQAIKLRLRKTKADALDDDIMQLAAVAEADLKRIGVADKYLIGCADPLLREAIITYVNANYGSNPDMEKLMISYDMLLTKIKGGRYRE